MLVHPLNITSVAVSTCPLAYCPAYHVVELALIWSYQLVIIQFVCSIVPNLCIPSQRLFIIGCVCVGPLHAHVKIVPCSVYSVLKFVPWYFELLTANLYFAVRSMY